MIFKSNVVSNERYLGTKTWEQQIIAHLKVYSIFWFIKSTFASFKFKLMRTWCFHLRDDVSLLVKIQINSSFFKKLANRLKIPSLKTLAEKTTLPQFKCVIYIRNGCQSVSNWLV